MIHAVLVIALLCLSGTRAWGASTGTKRFDDKGREMKISSAIYTAEKATTTWRKEFFFIDSQFYMEPYMVAVYSIFEQTVKISIDWPKFCAKFGHCWEFIPCNHPAVGHYCAHNKCKYCGQTTPTANGLLPQPEPELELKPGPNYPLKINNAPVKIYPGRDPREVKP